MDMIGILVLVISFFFLLVVGVPVAYSIGVAGILTMLVNIDSLPALTTYAMRMASGLDSFALLAIPFFILAGNIMARDCVYFDDEKIQVMRADHAARGIHGRHVDGDVVAAMQDVVEVGDVLDGGGQAPGGLGGNVRVVAKHVHAQIDGGVGHQRADGA